MAKSSGECLQFKEGVMVNKSCWKTQKAAEKALSVLQRIDVAPKDPVIYKCVKCNQWHFGKAFEKEWFEKK